MSKTKDIHLLPKDIIRYINDDHLFEKKDDFLHHLGKCHKCFRLFNKLSAINEKWVSLDEDENLSSPLISRRLLEKKFSKYQESEKKKREIQLKEWEEVLK